MKYSFKKVCINSSFPTTQFGHIQQTYFVNEYKDNLYARVLGLVDDNNNWYIHVVADLIGVKEELRNKIQDSIRKYYNNNKINVVIGVTHTHYANNIYDSKYEEFFANKLVEEITSMKYKEYDNVTTSYRRIHTTPCGKSRITGYETNLEYLSVVSFYSNDINLMDIIIHNCHPTTLKATTDFFSAEYPGQLMNKLEQAHPDTNFMFMQGAAGDISSRFVRDGQEYEDMLKLADNIYNETEKLLETDEIRKPFKCEYVEERIEVKHDFTPIDLSNIRQELTPRELETIEFGKIMRSNLEKQGNFIKEAIVSRVNLGAVKLVYSCNELMSEYMKDMNLDERMLVCYTNGDWPYVLPLDFNYITYEMFYDTWSKQSKEKLLELLERL